MVTFLREPKTSTIFGIEQQPSGVHIPASEDSIDLVGRVSGHHPVITVPIIKTTQNGVASNVTAFEA